MKIAVSVMSIMVMCLCRGSISEERRLEEKQCRLPKGKPGSVRTDGCIKSTCANGKWKTEMRTDICCYKQQAHKTNTALDTIVGADNCSSTTIGCGAVGQLEFSHKNCADPATKQQVEKLENNVEDLSDKVSRKLENQAEKIEELTKNQAEKIEDLTRKLENQTHQIKSLENNVQEKLENQTEKIEELTKNQAEKIEELTKSQTEKIEELTKSQADKIEDLTNNMESLTQMVKDNIGDQAEMSLQMMKTLTNLTQLMVKHSDDTPMVEGVLITGGRGAYTTTELFLPHTGKTCILQPLPDSRSSHSLDVVSDKIILCGGSSTQTSCLQFLTTSSTGSWAYYTTLAQGRYYHTTHSFQEDLLLMGGGASKGTTEIIGKGMQYNLQQETRQACSIPDGSSTILTGGLGSPHVYLKTVARYNMKGFVVNLPDLATARQIHGCGSYVNTGNTKVLVVAGGHNGGGYLSSTELFVSGATAWTSGDSLPRTLGWAGSVNMGPYFLLIGGHSSGTYGGILKFDGTWTEVGMMNPARYGASATKIELTDGFLNITGCN